MITPAEATTRPVTGVSGPPRYYLIACHVLWRELSYFAAQSPNTIMLQFLDQGLHNEPDTMRQRLQEAIDTVDDDWDAVLLGYGLCSNGVAGLVARDKPLVVMRGHDCITFLLGSKERYERYFKEFPGTYWYSPGWIETRTQPGRERYESAREYYVEKYGEDNADFLMECEQAWIKNYARATYVDLGVGDRNEAITYTRECADYLGWEFDRIEGDPGLVQRFVNGQWESGDFLIVPPGQEIVATHDERVIAAKPRAGQH